MSMSTGFRVTLVTLAAIIAGAALTLLHLENARLERRVAAFRMQKPLHEENARLGELLRAQAKTTGDAGALRAEIARTRDAIAELEKQAAAHYAERQARLAHDAAALATNRDPRSGPVRVEFFQPRGQASPGAAFESMIAAVIHGDTAALRELCALPAAAREQAKAFIARLPPEAQAEWTPEKLATLWATGAVTEMSAVQITGESFADPEHAVVTFRLLGRPDEERAKLVLSPNGWRVVVPSSVIERLEKKLQAAAPAR
jgi:hypothetical protein